MKAQNSNAPGPLLYDFSKMKNPSGWMIVNDGVMGGLSKGSIRRDDKGNGVFSGIVSLENNGGFSLARLSLEPVSARGCTAIVLEIKGDGKSYQLRIKSQRKQMHAYTQRFKTNGSWQRIVVPFEDLSPTFRGRKLDLPGYPGERIEEIGLLAGNKKNEKFQLLIRSIYLE
jgi:hypothetical protein